MKPFFQYFVCCWHANVILCCHPILATYCLLIRVGSIGKNPYNSVRGRLQVCYHRTFRLQIMQHPSSSEHLYNLFLAFIRTNHNKCFHIAVSICELRTKPHRTFSNHWLKPPSRRQTSPLYQVRFRIHLNTFHFNDLICCQISLYIYIASQCNNPLGDCQWNDARRKFAP